MSRDDWVVAVRNEDEFTIANRQGCVALTVVGINALYRVALRAIDAIVIIFQVNLSRAIVDLMLMRRIYLKDNEPIRGVLGTQDLAYLASCIASSTYLDCKR